MSNSFQNRPAHQLPEQIKHDEAIEKEHIRNYFENKKKIADCSNKTTLLDNFFKISSDDNTLNEELKKERKNIQKLQSG